ncbi:Acyl-CoA thioesterase [Frankia canadensis]|uniref:Acyl-CoA thioesterase n=1 Tax=Frankia canadensis TaxID=1836972 RepID=A0A2I2KJD6_9ACTN|nr:Acyl-CoA thioesterase [Frankia canadensis]SOU53079.1 Acyl-CoA thioesterase [Frankia canadensis]
MPGRALTKAGGLSSARTGSPDSAHAREFADLLGVAPVDTDLFEALTPARPGLPRLFGGDVAARALAAAQHTLPAFRPVHALHGFFLLEGQPGERMLLRVERVRDGRSFATRQVSVTQNGRTIFTLTASFHREEAGADLAVAFPAGIVPPELAEHHPTDVDDFPAREPLDVIELLPFPGTEVGVGMQRRVWMRSRAPLPDDPAVHTRALTYASDFNTGHAVARAAGIEPADAIVASLSHSLWLHRPFRFDDWILMEMSCDAAAGARGLVSGTAHTRDGAHIATYTQEVLLRIRRPDH